MKLLDLYIELCKNNSFYEKYYSTSSKNYGKVFSFINTNYRGILLKSGDKLQGFANGFEVLEKVEGIKRSEWVHNAGTNQEVEKQHVVNMRKSEFFRVVDDAYEKTSRGVVFKKLIEDDNLSHEEKNLICLILIISGYFTDTPNYIIERTKEFFALCNDAGYSDEDVLLFQKSFISEAINSKKKSEIFLHDYLYIDSFFCSLDGINFLKNYHDASIQERVELQSYVKKKYDDGDYGTKSNECLLSYKFKPGGNYVKNTVIDNAWILFVTKKIINAECKGFDEFVSVVIKAYKELFSVDEARLRTFIYDTDKNRSVLQVIFCKVHNLPLSPLQVEKDLTPEEIKELGASDTTDIEGAVAIDSVSASLKKLAKLNANYKCTLDECEMCKYFTAKENNKNYLEIHHLIPREFANDFDAPIEIIENYVALCPNCHRKIHLAVDTERKHMVNILYGQRKALLEQHGLKVALEDLYKYYKIED